MLYGGNRSAAHSFVVNYQLEARISGGKSCSERIPVERMELEDWGTGFVRRILVVMSEIGTGISPQVYDTPHYKLLGFLDDYRLAIKVSRWPGDDMRSHLLVLDVEGGALRAPIRTWFHTFESWAWMMEAGGYKPSLQDVLHAPFYPDPSQRILALSLHPRKGFLVMRVETLLRLARERAGRGILWEEWNPYLIETPLENVHPEQYVKCWVSGFQLFRVSILWITGRCFLDVYDFSADARTRLLRPGGGIPRVMHPSVAAYRLPWRAVDIRDLSAPAWTTIVWSSE